MSALTRIFKPVWLSVVKPYYWDQVRKVSIWIKWIFALLIYPWVAEYILWRPVYTFLHFRLGSIPLFDNSATPFFYFFLKVNVPLLGLVRGDLWLTAFVLGLIFVGLGLKRLQPDIFENPEIKPDLTMWGIFFAGLWMLIVCATFPPYWPF